MAQAQTSETTNGELADALRALLKSGLELGVAEAVRRLSLIGGASAERARKAEVDSILVGQALAEFIRSVREDDTGIFQLVKEVWSRGDLKDRRTAAHALGHGLSRLAPHKALGLSHSLASMARGPKEADMVGSEAIGPILEQNPPFVDRVKVFLKDNEVWVRRAAIAGLVAYVRTKKKMAGATLEIILLIAAHNEKEIRSAVKWAVREISAMDWRASAKAIGDWARSDPANVRLAKQYASSSAEAVRAKVERLVFTSLTKFADGDPSPAGPR